MQDVRRFANFGSRGFALGKEGVNNSLNVLMEWHQGTVGSYDNFDVAYDYTDDMEDLVVKYDHVVNN